VRHGRGRGEYHKVRCNPMGYGGAVIACFARRERPRRSRAADQCDEFAPPHWADPKAKDHGTKDSKGWGGVVGRIATKRSPMTTTTPSGQQVGFRISRRRRRQS